MKRILGLVLSLALLLSLAACGAAPEATDAPEQTTPVTAPATDVPTDEATEEATVEATEAPTEEPTEEPTEPISYVGGNQDLINDGNLVFTLKEFVNNEHLGLEMHVYCENKTDKNMIFSLSNVSVCGVMFDPLWAEEVAPGKMVNSVVYFDTYALSELGIESVDEINFRLQVINSDEWMDEPFADQTFTVYPTGLTADEVTYPAYRHKNGETVVLDNDQLLFIVEKVDDAGDDTYTLHCYIANRTETDLLVSWDGVSVNGYMVDPFWAAGICGGKQLYTQITFFRSDLDAQGIETVTDIGFTLTATDYDSYDTLLEQALTFQPK